MATEPSRTPRVLSIAGSDSGGGAGIQADLKAFARCGVHGMTAITAVTCQNTVAVTGVTPVPPEAIVGQVRAVVDDIGVDAVKIGMLGSVETAEAVTEALALVQGVPMVLDPVMVAESGAPLLEPDAMQALIELLPRATVITPNLLEARARQADEGTRTAPTRSTCSGTVSTRSRYRAPGIPAARRTARVAPTPPRSPLTSPLAWSRSRPRWRPSASPPRPCGTLSRTSAQALGRSTRSASPHAGRPSGLWHNPAGEVLAPHAGER